MMSYCHNMLTIRCSIILKYINEKKEFKIGFSDPKRLHQSAVIRNLIKRRMRESFRLQQQLLGPSFSGIGYFIYNNENLYFDICFIL